MIKGASFITLLLAVAAAVTSAQGLPPGHHSAQPKYVRVLNRMLTNYTPLRFDYRIENLTPTPDGGLWFSVGSSIERIDPNGSMTDYAMPSSLWHVSAVTYAGGNVWFSAGQSGKVGMIDARRRLRFVQAVPRRFFPDIRDLVVNRNGDMWFVDAGRRSIGYRSVSGRLVEHPLPGHAWPGRMQHCMGKLWLIVNTPESSRLAVVDDDLYARVYRSEIPERATINALSCDARNDLWLTLNNRFRSSTSNAARIGRNGSVRLFTLPASSAGDIALNDDGSAWISVQISSGGWPGLVQIDQHGVTHTYVLRMDGTPGDIAVGEDGAIWLGIGNGNSPLSVARFSQP